MKHTSGPWTVEDGTIICFSNSQYELCRTELSADANLISAAPELLEALKYILEFGILPKDGTMETMAQNAINKATGVK